MSLEQLPEMVPSLPQNGTCANAVVRLDSCSIRFSRGGAMAVVTIFVSNMDRAVRFYTEVLGMKLAYRFGDDWASVEVGKGLTIGLHPASGEMPAGRKGSMAIGLELA